MLILSKIFHMSSKLLIFKTEVTDYVTLLIYNKGALGEGCLECNSGMCSPRSGSSLLETRIPSGFPTEWK